MTIRSVPFTDSKYLCYPSYMRRAARLIREDHPNGGIVHLHSPAVYGYWGARLAASGFNVIAHGHGLEWRARKWPWWMQRAMRWSEGMSLRVAAEYLVVSLHEFEYFKRLYPQYAHKLRIVVNGVPRSGLRTRFTAQRLGIADGGFLLFVGRLVPQKRVEDLIRAFQMSASQRRLVIVGEDSYSRPYAESLRLRLGSRVVFTGGQEHDAVLDLMATAAALVLPSESEGCPNVLLEAIGLGCVPLISDIRAHRDIGGERLRYFPVGDTYELSRQIVRLESDATWRRAAVRDLARLKGELPGWDEVTDRLEAAYRRVAPRLVD